MPQPDEMQRRLLAQSMMQNAQQGKPALSSLVTQYMLNMHPGVGGGPPLQQAPERTNQEALAKREAARRKYRERQEEEIMRRILDAIEYTDVVPFNIADNPNIIPMSKLGINLPRSESGGIPVGINIAKLQPTDIAWFKAEAQKRGL